jgi:hypothetical protein
MFTVTLKRSQHESQIGEDLRAYRELCVATNTVTFALLALIGCIGLGYDADVQQARTDFHVSTVNHSNASAIERGEVTGFDQTVRVQHVPTAQTRRVTVTTRDADHTQDAPMLW